MKSCPPAKHETSQKAFSSLWALCKRSPMANAALRIKVSRDAHSPQCDWPQESRRTKTLSFGMVPWRASYGGADKVSRGNRVVAHILMSEFGAPIEADAGRLPRLGGVGKSGSRPKSGTSEGPKPHTRHPRS